MAGSPCCWNSARSSLNARRTSSSSKRAGPAQRLRPRHLPAVHGGARSGGLSLRPRPSGCRGLRRSADPQALHSRRGKRTPASSASRHHAGEPATVRQCIEKYPPLVAGEQHATLPTMPRKLPPQNQRVVAAVPADGGSRSGDLGVLALVAAIRFLALVALDRVAAGLRVNGVAQLDEHRIAWRVPSAGARNRAWVPSGMAGSMERPTMRATNIPSVRVVRDSVPPTAIRLPLQRSADRRTHRRPRTTAPRNAGDVALFRLSFDEPKAGRRLGLGRWLGRLRHTLRGRPRRSCSG